MFTTPTFEDLQIEALHQEPRDPQTGRLFGKVDGVIYDDRGLMVGFYKRPIQNVEKSRQEGRAIFDEHEFIMIAIPGDLGLKIDTFATDEHRARFPLDYKKFKDKGQYEQVGTPLTHWKGVNTAQAAELRALNIVTVEQLAELSDAIGSKYAGIYELKAKAKAFIEQAKDEKLTKQQIEQEKRLKDQENLIATQQAQLDMMKKQLDQLTHAGEKPVKK